MSVQKWDAEPRDLSEPIELRPGETELVAGGSPTLPLPPPRHEFPVPNPW
jgi:hypothetical protein